VAAGAGALSRSELVLIVPLMIVPLAVLVPGLRRADRWRGVLAGAAAALVVMAPWFAYNISRFEQPELLSTQFGLTLSSANCDRVWNGYHKSYFDIRCSLAIEQTLPKGLDASQQDARHRTVALRYVGDHLSKVPEIALVRLGAIVGLYHPEYQLTLDGVFEGRGMAAARAATYAFWALALASIAGAVVLRRRRTVPVFPLLVPPVMVAVTAVTVYASTRFRASAEVSVCLLAAVALDAVLAHRSGGVGEAAGSGPAGPHGPWSDPHGVRETAGTSVDTASGGA
jgi:4-amino-4-deoxy-L-arabinose transferase-like glycosyltransferase